MKKLLLHLIFLLTIPTSFAQGWLSIGARSNSLSNASVTLTDVWAFHHNPGALGEVTELTAGVSYENRFLLKELQSQGMAFAYPLKVGVISVGAQLYGYQLFRSQRVGAGYSLKLADFLFAGVQLNYQGIQLSQNYGSYSGMTAELGLQALISEKWRVGMSVFNLGRAKLSEFEDDRLSTIMRLGTSFKPSNKLMLLAEVQKDLEHDLSVKGGVEYEAIKQFYLRIGAATQPTTFSFGLGYKWKVIQLDLGSGYHQVLGWSPHFSLTYSK